MKTDELSLDQAYQKLYKYVYQYVLTQGNISEPAADAITSDVFYSLHLKWNTLRSHNEKVLTTWVIRAAVLLIKKHRRQNAKQAALYEDNANEVLENIASNENIVQEIEAVQQCEALLNEIRLNLTPSEWELFEDFYIQKIPDVILAQKRGITTHALEQRRSRLKKKLQDILSNRPQNVNKL